MDLFVGPLPNHITNLRIKHFFRGFEKYIQFEIRHLTHEGHLINYAVVTATSPRIGKKLITKFNAKILNGSPVVVRQFVHRCTGNERRSIKWRNQPWKFFNRRIGNERRRYRQFLEVEDMWLTEKNQQPASMAKKQHIA